jgi:hypothetical protein
MKRDLDFWIQRCWHHRLLPTKRKFGQTKIMDIQEVASELAALCREQKWLKAIDNLDASDIVSVEVQGIGKMPAEIRGLDQVRGKTQWFQETSQLHSCTIGVCRAR